MRFRSLADQWRSTASFNGGAVARMIREDEIDILIDLAGHTYGARLDVFLHRAAPVQLTYLGYPNTTGIPAIHGRLVDDITDPSSMGADQLATESLIRIPACFVCFSPDDALRDAPIPEGPTSGPVTFGVFTNPAKLSNASIALWSAILQQIPGSRLVIKGRGLEDAPTWQRFADRFAAAGAPAGSVQVMPYSPDFASHIASFGQVDIVLDTYPYNGTTTTCEQLWMGVPVLTLAGRTHVSRVGASLLTASGLSDWIADSPEGYLERALRLSVEVRAGIASRAERAERVRGSALCDGAGFGVRFGSALDEAWRQFSTNSKVIPESMRVEPKHTEKAFGPILSP